MSISFTVISCIISITAIMPVQNPEGYEINRKPLPSPKEHKEKITTPSQDPRMDGFWPSSRMIHLALTRLVDDVSQKYKLSESQRQLSQKNAIDRWEKFLEEHRTTVQPLMNEFLEMRLELEPPTKKSVQEWAKRVVPVFEKYKKEMDRTTEEFRKVLDPMQQEEFDIDMMQMGAMMRIAGGTLHRWQLGEFDPKFFWEPHENQRDGIQDELHGKQGATRSELPQSRTRKIIDPILSELDAWEQYVEQFIRDYNLDKGQCDAARSCLGELRLRAHTHRERYKMEIAQLEKKIITNQGGEKEFQYVKALLDKLYGPIDDMFKELKHRIKQIPSAEQCVEAAVKIDKQKKSEPTKTKSPESAGEGVGKKSDD